MFDKYGLSRECLVGERRCLFCLNEMISVHEINKGILVYSLVVLAVAVRVVIANFVSGFKEQIQVVTESVGKFRLIHEYLVCNGSQCLVEMKCFTTRRLTRFLSLLKFIDLALRRCTVFAVT